MVSVSFGCVYLLCERWKLNFLLFILTQGHFISLSLEPALWLWGISSEFLRVAFLDSVQHFLDKAHCIRFKQGCFFPSIVKAQKPRELNLYRCSRKMGHKEAQYLSVWVGAFFLAQFLNTSANFQIVFLREFTTSFFMSVSNVIYGPLRLQTLFANRIFHLALPPSWCLFPVCKHAR